jgi:hypothetical protein
VVDAGDRLFVAVHHADELHKGRLCHKPDGPVLIGQRQRDFRLDAAAWIDRAADREGIAAASGVV